MKPNQMPKKSNVVQQKVVDGLISVSPTTWKKKELRHDDDGKETVETVQVTHNALRYPLARNVSDSNVERLARKWL